MADLDDLLKRAEDFRGRSMYRDTLRTYRRALKIAGTDEERMPVLQALGDTCRMTGDFTAGVEYYEEGIALAKKLKRHLEALDASVGLGLARRGLGDWKAALKHLNDAHKKYEKKGDAEGTAFTLWALAGTLRIKGDIPEAVKTYELAHEAFSALGDQSGVGYCLCGLGGSSRVMGNFTGSLKYYTQANKLFRELKDSFGTAYSHCGIGNALRMKDDLSGAAEYFAKATRLYRRIGDIVSFSYTLWSQGKVYLMSGKPGLSERFTEEALGNFKKTRDPRGVIYCLLSEAEVFYLRERTAPAKRKAQKALDEAAAHGFQVELCHAQALLSFLETGEADNSCYRELGLKLKFKDIPFNIP